MMVVAGEYEGGKAAGDGECGGGGHYDSGPRYATQGSPPYTLRVRPRSVTYCLPSVTDRYAMSPVDNDAINGKFSVQSSTGLAGRVGWRVALVKRRGGGEGSQPSGAVRGQPSEPVCVCPAVRGLGPGKDPGSSVDNGVVFVADGHVSGPKAPPGSSSAAQRR